jgi:Uma2 family endonuclease
MTVLAAAPGSRPETGTTAPLVLRTRPALHLSDDQFFAFCQQNPDLRIEQTAEGDWIIMPPPGGETGNRNAGLTAQLYAWSSTDGTGVSFDSSTGFVLFMGAKRAPDASWVLRARLAGLTPEQRRQFLPLCPDFVVELRSPSDSLEALQEKLNEYIAAGARLGWLIDPVERRVHVYRPGAPVEERDNPETLSGDPELPGFTLDLARIWEPDF